LPEQNLRGIESVKEHDPAVLAAIVRHDNAAFVSEAAGQPAGAVFPGEGGADLSLELMASIHLGELLVHGWDIATTLGRPWAIGRMRRPSWLAVRCPFSLCLRTPLRQPASRSATS